MKRIVACWIHLLGIGMMLLLLAGCNYPMGINEKPAVDDALGVDGYPLMTREQIGNIPAGTHVKVKGILAHGGLRLYRIVTQDDTTAEAREDQLVVAPNVTLVPTPTITFIDAVGQSGYPLMTLEQVGSIPTGTRVMAGGVWFDGINMVYLITSRDGVTAEAREYQLAVAPGVTLAAMGPTPTAAFESVANLAGFPLVTLELVGDIPAGTLVRGFSTHFDGTHTIYQVTAQNGSTAEAREDQVAMAPGYTPAPIPIAIFQGGYPLITLEQVGHIPAGTSVRSGGSWYDGTSNMYQIFAQDGTTAEARESQLAYAPGVTPGPTPTAIFYAAFTMAGYPLITLEPIGDIPAGTHVSVGTLWFDGINTMYQIIAPDGTTTEARQNQLVMAPDYTLPAATPTATFLSFTGMGGYPLITLEQVGSIPAGERVNVGATWYDGSSIMYQIFARDGSSAEAREDQLMLAPGATPGPTPIAQFESYIGMGYLLITTEQVGNIPAGARVRISHASRDEYGWLYFIVAQDEVTTAEARDNQLTPAPYATPGPSPTPTHSKPY